MSQDTKIERLENKVTELQRAVTSQNNQLTQIAGVVDSLRAEVVQLKKQVAEQGK
ncbi:TPA: hypothetical protein NIU34_000922 [Klebsiella oxytoca]|uniref:SlyX family protein n=1 Tax=Klebsiella oxytoca TaxID=571 RepID=UPI0013D7B2F1|nr:SlyX family protein [Klebsiella oxytoca]EGT0045217.1 SlyX family protein [Klebsiella oxytoca]MBZ7697011.1 SlyX family protein [Klebsiella oxytoca]WDQ08450.1 SlyX family protein [Klebsiella oxytoca]HCF7883754.1 hypothetical protein [Klebsiella oxytoca]HEC2091433.1 hypothetical protein [Klebsiella oxytoca]